MSETSDTNRTFQIGLWPTLATAVGLILLASLAIWQTRQYSEKKSREEVRDRRVKQPPAELSSVNDLDDELNYRRVEFRGELDTSTHILIKHRSYEGDPGSWLVQPLELEGTDEVILVNRGWIPFQKAKEEAAVARYASPPDERPLVGLLYRYPTVIAEDDNRRKLESGELNVRGERTDWDSFDVSALYDELDAPTPDRPWVVVLAPDHSGDRYPIASYAHITKPYMTSERHFGYALFWFAVAVALVAIYLAAGFGALGSHPRGRGRVPGGHDRRNEG